MSYIYLLTYLLTYLLIYLIFYRYLYVDESLLYAQEMLVSDRMILPHIDGHALKYPLPRRDINVTTPIIASR